MIACAIVVPFVAIVRISQTFVPAATAHVKKPPNPNHQAPDNAQAPIADLDIRGLVVLRMLVLGVWMF
jgi:hypothetical protein